MTKPSLSQAAGMIDNTTYPQTTRSSDPHRQQDLYSNKRGKDECALQGHLTCCAGHVEATRPGKIAIAIFTKTLPFLINVVPGLISKKTSKSREAGFYWLR